MRRPPSSLVGRWTAWAGAEDPEGGIDLFRRIFAGIWLAYDLTDLLLGTTERAVLWLPHPRNLHFVLLQIVLAGAGAALAVLPAKASRFVWLYGMLAAAARAIEALFFFPLNDFYFGSVVYLLVAHSAGGPFASDRHPRWVRDALLAQLAFVYAATGVLKLSPDWLGGGHLFVRTQYLGRGLGWPYPAPIARAFATLRADSWLAALGALSELTLSAVLFVRGPYLLAVALAIGIHAFGAAVTDVWFFSASMIAAVVLLLPRRTPRRRVA